MFETIESKRLTYRPFMYEDYPFLLVMLGDKLVCEFLPGPENYSNDVVKKVMNHYITSAFGKDKYQKIYLASRKDTQEPIGYVGIQLVKEFDKYEIFYGFIPSAWGQGFGSEASLRMKALAIDLDLKELIALADVQNIASQKILEKTGFKQTKQMPLWGLDVFYYEMTL